MFEPVKVAFAEYLQGFYKELSATTPALKEYKKRGFSYSFVYAPSRMVDQANVMLEAWQRNDTSGQATTPAKLPVIIFSFAKDYMPTGRDYSYQISDPVDVIIPSDEKERYFQLKTIAGDLRVQLAICAADEPTAKSIAAQLLSYVDSPVQRGFDARYQFAQQEIKFPCQIDTPDTPASNVETGSKNVTILAVDFTLHCTVPIYDAPDEDEPNDGKGSGPDDPSGFPLVDLIYQKDETTIRNGRDVEIGN
ncbi:hypothetical protein [Acinetobacter proteolyticus]|uniref:Uncharacterized protein n=1 Tax=Acinetobacter proteolyticus TaxID=1776741 RepID=A0A2N0WIH5_9GAMM|nr:hypothetical protein [Acinetobacter proteolyticus]PKF35573.1 hypothetical protein CW311_04600 [Acinetobacter proteolyticus]